MERGQWYPISETRRVYWYSQGAPLLIDEPRRLMVSESGNHYIAAAEGKNYIVAPGWSHIEFDSPVGFDIP